MTRRRTPSPLICLLLAALLALFAVPVYAGKGEKDKHPPVVTIDHPADGETVYGDELVVTGSVTDNVAVRLVTLKINSSGPVAVTLDAAGRFALPVALRPGKNKIKLKAKDTSGKTAKLKRTFHSVDVPAAPVGITIASPADGDVVHAAHVDVHGDFKDPVKRLRYMPGLRSAPGGFTIEAYPLTAGESSQVTVVGFDDDGSEYTSTIAVSSSSDAAPLTLTADPATGVIPLTVNFSLANNTPEVVTSYEIDYTGNGDYVPLPDGITGLAHTYDAEGPVAPTVRVRTADGHIFSSFALVSPYRKALYLASMPANDVVDLEVDGQGRLFILERFDCRVVVTDADLNVLATFGSRGTDPGKFLGPTGLALDVDGNIYVSDISTDTVQVFSPAFEHIATWGTSGEAPGELDGVRGIEVSPGGSTVLADTTNRRVSAFLADGTYTGIIGPDDVIQPRDAAWMGGDQFAVSDSANGTVNIYSPGRLAPHPWRTPPPAFGMPTGLAYDRHNGWLLVADEEENRITIVMAENREGVVVRHIDSLVGDYTGLIRPVATARAKSPVENIYFIADSGRRRVVKVQLPDGDTPVAAWSGIRDALAGGDIDAALSHFVPSLQERYRDLFTNAGDQLPVIAQDMSEIYPLNVTEQQAVYGILRYDDGKPFLFEVVFVRDGEGEWKILQW